MGIVYRIVALSGRMAISFTKDLINALDSVIGLSVRNRLMS